MKHGTHCKFCHIPISPEISDDYIGDPLKIIGLACCNHCAELRVERRTLETNLVRTCMVFHRSSESTRILMSETVRNTLEPLTKAYTRLIADWHKLTPEWDQAIVDRLMKQPDRVIIILNSLWPHGS